MRTNRATWSAMMAAALLTAGCGPMMTAGSPVAAATTIRTITPLDSAGRIDGTWSITVEPEWMLDCGQASDAAAGPNVQQCGPGAAGAAVCWAQPGQHDVFCGTGPWQTTLRKLYSADQITNVQAPIDPQPWGVELIDGTRCTLMTSGAWPAGPDGTSPAYWWTKNGADTDLYVLADNTQPINRSGPIWTAKLGQIGNDPQGLSPASTVPIREAIFAG